MPQFSTDDLRTAESLERVLRQFQSEMTSKVTASQAIPSLGDLVTALAPLLRDQLQAQGSAPLNLQSLLPATGNGLVLVDTHANRITTIYDPNNYQTGQLFYETDRTDFYMVNLASGAKVWQWVDGIYANTLANLVTGLGTADAGFLFEVTDYDHVLQWTGSAWTWGPGEAGSGYYMMYENAPNSIGANSWQICDGSTVAMLKADGTTTNVTTPALATPAYLKGATVALAVAAASGTVGATTATNQNESAHTHSVTSPTGNNSAGTTVDNNGGGSTVSVAADPHTHTVTSPTGAGSAHTHVQNAHDHGPGTLELRNKQTALYFRR